MLLFIPTLSDSDDGALFGCPDDMGFGYEQYLYGSEPHLLLSISKLSDGGALSGCPDDFLDMISNSGTDSFFLSLFYLQGRNLRTKLLENGVY